MPADSVIARVKAPLLMLYTLDDFLWHRQRKLGRHDGGSYSLDPHWFGLGVMSYLKHRQARTLEHVPVAVPPVDILAEGTLSGETVTYRLLVRNHGPTAAGPPSTSPSTCLPVRGSGPSGSR